MKTIVKRAAVILVFSVSLHQQADAQVSYRSPAAAAPAGPQPRLSPYLNLLRSDNAVLNPYHTFVQPRQEIQQNLSRQQAQIGRLQQTTMALGTDQQSAAARQHTGHIGGFNNYLHYYQFSQPFANGRRHASGF